MKRLVIELEDHEAEQLEYRANSINGGSVRILVPNDAGNGYHEYQVKVTDPTAQEEE